MTTQGLPQFETELKELLSKYGIDAVTFFGFYTDGTEPSAVGHIYTFPSCPAVYEIMATHVFQAGYYALGFIPSAHIVAVRQDVGNGISQDPDKN